MCFNAFGLGALNMYWIIFGTLMVLMNLLSYDCSTSMTAFAGITNGYTCDALENFLNVQWVLGYVGYMGTGLALALLPKLVKDYPPAANKAVMLTYSCMS